MLHKRNWLRKVKKNFWMPEGPDDYEKLKPRLVLSNGPLAETWNTCTYIFFYDEE